MRAPAASSQAGSWSRQASQAAATSSGPDRPAPFARSRARASLASWRSALSRSLARSAQSAYGSPGSSSRSSARAAARASSLAWPGGIASPARSASAWVVGVDQRAGGKPQVREIGAEQRDAGLAELRERGAGHGQRLGQRAGGRPRCQAREQLLAGQVTAHPAAGADQEQRAEPPGSRPRPRSSRPVARRDSELAEQPDPDRLAGRPVCPVSSVGVIPAAISSLSGRGRHSPPGIPAGQRGPVRDRDGRADGNTAGTAAS